ncbi:MAG: hypothetical protein ACI8Z5_000856 [Lentimonas sp.]|jgi:hypothetical protein
MKPKDMTPPPPAREPKRQLSLKAAMAIATKAEGHQALKPLMNPMDEFPSAQSGAQQDMEARLLELQADIINREELLSQNEKQYRARELELNEREALLEARTQIIESAAANSTGPSSSSNTQEALEALKRTLDAQEVTLKDTREARVEQREEDFSHYTNSKQPEESTADQIG